MGYKAIITIDLPYANNSAREKFYLVLEDCKWIKINNLTTAWRALFKDEVNSDNAIKVLKHDIEKAKKTANISTVHFAIQIGENEIITS